MAENEIEQHHHAHTEEETAAQCNAENLVLLGYRLLVGGDDDGQFLGYFEDA